MFNFSGPNDNNTAAVIQITGEQLQERADRVLAAIDHMAPAYAAAAASATSGARKTWLRYVAQLKRTREITSIFRQYVKPGPHVLTVAQFEALFGTFLNDSIRSVADLGNSEDEDEAPSLRMVS